MSVVAKTLDVSRPNLHEHVKGSKYPRGRYKKAEDTVLLQMIRHLVDERPTYGYHRIAALVNRQRLAEGLHVVNLKRIHRIMSNHQLLLSRHMLLLDGRTHDGKVMVMRSNLRWRSDALEFTCWNGEVIRLAFIIDAYDREIITWVGVTNTGISGSDIRDIMLEAVEKRFANTKALHLIEHLSDNGSCYTLLETKRFAVALNFEPCFTPVKSPRSNGMSEAFVKTLKRDYITIANLPDAKAAFRQINGWIEDYNEIHPHSVLNMNSSKMFRTALNQ